eukprot:scaffold561_cov254-Pinguiococcus_pyrenoidosus.AAC.7
MALESALLTAIIFTASALTRLNMPLRGAAKRSWIICLEGRPTLESSPQSQQKQIMGATHPHLPVQGSTRYLVGRTGLDEEAHELPGLALRLVDILRKQKRQSQV